MFSQQDDHNKEAKVAEEAKTTTESSLIKSSWGRKLKNDLDSAELYEDDIDRVNKIHDILLSTIDTFVVYCNIAIDNKKEDELLDLIFDAKCLGIDYRNLNISKGFSISPLEKICKSSRLVEKVSNILGIASENLQSICKPKELTGSERCELINAFFTNIKNFRPSIYSLTDVLGYARNFSIDLKRETTEGMDAIQALCFSSHYTHEQRIRVYGLLSSYGIKLENIAEANQLIRFFCHDSNKIQSIEAALMIIKHTSFVLEASFIQACILQICEPAIGRTNSYWMEVAYKPSLLQAMSAMLNYVIEYTNTNSGILGPIISFCIEHKFPKDFFELLRHYSHSLKEHKNIATSPAPSSHISNSFIATMAKTSSNESTDKQPEEETKLTNSLVHQFSSGH